MKKSILAFGMDLPSVEGFESVDIDSGRSALDGDIVVVEFSLSSFFSEYGNNYDGLPLMSNESSFKYREARQLWQHNFSTALSTGKTIIVYLTEQHSKYYYTGDRTYSGTGRNARQNDHVAKCNNYDFLPTQLVNPVFGRGAAMNLDPSAGPLSEYWATFGAYSIFNVHFDEGTGSPLVRTKSGNKVVGCVRSTSSGGHIVMLPELIWSDAVLERFAKPRASNDSIDEDAGDELEEYGDEDDEAGDADDEALIAFTTRLRDALFEIDRNLTQGKDQISAPDWAGDVKYKLDIEGDIERNILSIGDEIRVLEEQKALLAVKLREHGSSRLLLYGKGLPLEAAVRAALTALGFDTHNFKSGEMEFDAIFTADGYRYIGEVEGKDAKAINIDKLSQLQRNITEDYSREEVDEPAIGVLFGNAHRLLPPSERGESFTQKVTNLSKTMRVALVKTSDLFECAYVLAHAPDEEFARSCREAIRLGVGGVVEFPTRHA